MTDCKQKKYISQEKYIDPAVNEVKLITKQIINDVADEVVELDNKVYDVI